MISILAFERVLEEEERAQGQADMFNDVQERLPYGVVLELPDRPPVLLLYLEVVIPEVPPVGNVRGARPLVIEGEATHASHSVVGRVRHYVSIANLRMKFKR